MVCQKIIPKNPSNFLDKQRERWYDIDTIQIPSATDEQGGEPRGAERAIEPFVWAVFIRKNCPFIISLREGGLWERSIRSNRSVR